MIPCPFCGDCPRPRGFATNSAELRACGCGFSRVRMVGVRGHAGSFTATVGRTAYARATVRTDGIAAVAACDSLDGCPAEDVVHALICAEVMAS